MTAGLRFFLSPEAKAAGVQFRGPKTGDAGFDLPASTATELEPGELKAVPTGVSVAIPLGWVGLVRDRSGMALKGAVCTAGVIDASYRGEIKVVMHNLSSEKLSFKPGDRIAQLLVIQHLTGEGAVEVSSSEELGDTDRGSGGFGSTGR